MCRIQKLAKAPRMDMEYGRGTVIRSLGEVPGAKLVDVHLNVPQPVTERDGLAHDSSIQG